LNAGVGTITRISNTSLVATSATVSSAFHVGSALTANAAGDVESIGIITAASFSGDGSSLTNVSGIVTSNIVSVAITTKDINVSAAATITGALTGSTGTFSGAVNVDATTDSTSSSTGALIVDGGLGVAKNVYIGAGLSVAGTLTYEDVTNVDSVGLITAKSGVNVTGGQLQVGVAYSVGAAGVATAAGFVGPLTGNVTGAVDLNGGVLTLDADADTTITADTDDQIDIAFGGSDRITLSTGLIDLKNSGSQSALRLYCESSNAHYTALQAAAHSAYSGNATVTLPASTDTLIGRATTDTLTNKTLSAPSITGDVSIADKIIHTGDTDTAIRFPAANTISAEAGATEKVRIDSTGVGIGTAPAEEVHILAATPTLLVEATNAASGGIVADVDVRAQSYRKAGYSISDSNANEDIFIGRPYASGDTTAPLVFDFQGTERVRFKQDGKVGINSSDPDVDLVVSHAGQNTGMGVTVYINSQKNNASAIGSAELRLGFKHSGNNNGKGDAYIKLEEDGNNSFDGNLTIGVPVNNGGGGSTTWDSVKFEGGQTGVDVSLSGTASGISSVTWDASANSLIFKDKSYLKFGDGSDLSIHHEAGSAYMDNGTGDLYMRNSSGQILIRANTNTYISNYAANEHRAAFNNNGSVDLYYDGTKKFETTNDGAIITGITTFSRGCAFNSMLKEEVNIVANKLSAGVNIDIDDGMIWYYSTNETATATPNIRYNSSKSLNNVMSTGQAVTVTIIYKPNGAGYYAALTVDGSGVTEEWNGGSAPSSANAGGFDVLTNTLVKTADATFLCLSNVQNYA